MKVGEIKVKVRFENGIEAGLCAAGRLPKSKVRGRTVEAVVDTGAVMMLLPQDLVETLGISVREKTIVRLADERQVELDTAGPVFLTIGDRTMNADCLVGPPGCEVLVGQLVMEQLDLIPDPRKRTITPRPESPFRPTLKLKSAGLCLAGEET